MHDVYVYSEHVQCRGIEAMDEQQRIREEQGVARLRKQQREHQARARVEETPKQREQRVARHREQDRKR